MSIFSLGSVRLEFSKHPEKCPHIQVHQSAIFNKDHMNPKVRPLYDILSQSHSSIWTINRCQGQLVLKDWHRYGQDRTSNKSCSPSTRRWNPLRLVMTTHELFFLVISLEVYGTSHGRYIHVRLELMSPSGVGCPVALCRFCVCALGSAQEYHHP